MAERDEGTGPAAPDERPQRRREYSGAGSTLGIAATVIAAVAVSIWYFQFRADGGGTKTEAPGLGIVSLEPDLNPTGRQPAAEIGRAAPDFRLAGPDGSILQLSSLRGRFVLINFWASWCGPCRSEAPDLQALADRKSLSLVVLGVNQQEDSGAVRRFLDDFRLSYANVMDRDGQVSAAYGVTRGLPVSFLVGPDGVVRAMHIGRLTAGDIATIERQFPS